MDLVGKVDAARAHGQWLRTQRQARGWSVPEMRRRLREAANGAGDTVPANDCLSVMIHRWEDDRSGMSERYRLHYCKAFQIPIEEFGSLRARPASVPGGPDLGVPVRLAGAEQLEDRRNPADLGRSWIEQEIVMAAHESNDHALHTERRDAGEATLEHLHAEVVRLSQDYMTGEPLTLFFEMRRVRDQIYTALDRKLWPRDQSDLYFLLGCLNHLMAAAADGLGNTPAAEELARAGLAYALAIGHRPLSGGEFSFSRASHHYYAGSAIADMPGSESDAIAELGRAIELYEAGPEPGEHHSLFCTMIARVDLAATWVRAGQLEAAVSVAGPVLALPFSQRISNLAKRFARARSALAAPRYKGSAEGRDFDQQIEEFCRNTVAAQLQDLPATPA